MSGMPSWASTDRTTNSTNESTIGKVGEFLTGQYRKRCQVWAVPCLGERHTLDGDKDDRE